MTAALWLAVIFLPLGTALLLVVPRWRGLLMRCAPATALPGLWLAGWTEPGTTVELPWLIIGLQFGLDVTARIFLLFTASLYFLVGFDALIGPRARRLDHRFTAFYLAAMSGNFGLIIAQDAASFYALFALMSFAAAGLVAYPRSHASHRATRVYLILVMLSEVLIFAGLVTACTGGSHLLDALPAQVLASRHVQPIVALLVAGFGIKTGLVLLHVWLPVSYQAAPIPAAALLSACMSKAGLLGWMRCLPIVDAGLPEWGLLLVIAGFITAFYAMAVGLLQQDPKAVLAYSSMSKMGVMTVLIGMALHTPATRDVVTAAVLLYALHHAAAKTALFLGLGAARARRTFWIALVIPSAALAGLPWTTGWIAKVALKVAAHDALPAYQTHLVNAMYAVAVLTTLLMIRFLLLVRNETHPIPSDSHVESLQVPGSPGTARPTSVSPVNGGWGEASRRAGMEMKNHNENSHPIQARSLQFVPALLAAAGVLLLPLIWTAPETATQPPLLSSLWPVALGGVLAVALTLPLPTLPCGDLLLVYERLARTLPLLVPAYVRRAIQREYSVGARLAEWLAANSPRDPIALRLAEAETRLRQGPVFGTLLLLIGAIAFLLALLNH